MTTESPGRRIRNIMAEPGIMICPGIFDGFSARLAEHMGFKTAAISGAGLSEARLGWVVAIANLPSKTTLQNYGPDKLNGIVSHQHPDHD